MLNEWIYFPLEESLGFPDSSVGKESACPRFDSWVGKIRWRRDRLSTPVFMGFPGGSAGKESTCNVGLSGFDPWVRNIPWRRERLPIHFRHFESKVVILAFFREYWWDTAPCKRSLTWDIFLIMKMKRYIQSIPVFIVIVHILIAMKQLHLQKKDNLI